VDRRQIVNPLTYLYCVVFAPSAPRLGRVPRGLPGVGPARVLTVDRSLFAIVADAPRRTYGEAAVNRGLTDLDWVSRAAVAHEAVVEHFIDAPAVLPAKLLTIFESDDRALAHLRDQRSRLAALARRISGQLEWGVRVSIDGSRAGAADTRASSRRRSAALSGAGYLQMKRARRDAREELAMRAKSTASELYRRLARKARAARKRSADAAQSTKATMLLDAAFLVPRSGTTSFRALAAAQAKALAAKGYVVTLTGPWPPYTFVQD
jgi:hypothetical protein